MPTDDNFIVVEESVEQPAADHVVVAVDVLSIDAFIRTVLEAQAYHGSVPIGGTVPALGVGHVLDSNAEGFEPGDAVFAPLGAQTIATLPAAMLRKLDTASVPATSYLGALGLTTGLTAYFGIIEVGGVKPGDTVVVSGAAGAVGSMAGQIARIAGAGKVIGIAGSAEKVAFLTNEMGFDAGIDYKDDDVDARLRELAPDGIDVFFDNVGGAILDSVLMQIRVGARVVICGAISQYDSMDDVRGPSNYLKLAERHAKMEGFAVTFFAERYGEAEAALTGWYSEGRLVMREHLMSGIDQFPNALRTLFNGGHHGKLLLDLRMT
jgi:NADPH-dependent curcumin reductase CurA